MQEANGYTLTQLRLAMGLPDPVTSVLHIVPSHVCILAIYYSGKCPFN